MSQPLPTTEIVQIITETILAHNERERKRILGIINESETINTNQLAMVYDAVLKQHGSHQYAIELTTEYLSGLLDGGDIPLVRIVP